MTITEAVIRCRVCHRPLRNLISIAEGVGPVCRKRVRQALHEMMESVRRGEADPNYQEAYAASPEELRTLVEADARRAYLESLRNRRFAREPVTVEIYSQTRGELENVTVRWIDNQRATVESASGHQYVTTLEACTCPQYVHRLSRDSNNTQGCRHMQALAMAREEVIERRSAARRETISSVSDIHQQNRRTFAQIDWTEEEQREQVLQIWKEERPFEGVFISQDDQAWSSLKEQALGEWEYSYENVLGGTGNSYGIEIEVEFDTQYHRTLAIRALYNEGIIGSDRLQHYHSTGRPGFWRAERDGSLGATGAEFVSPVLQDNRESWQQIERITNILKLNGARVTTRCGGHIHLGIAPLDHRTYSWQRLARIGVAYERQFFRMGGADSESFRQTGRPGVHRGIGYTKPFSSINFSGMIDAQTARDHIGSEGRYTMFNTRNIDRNNRPAIEMRYPNGSLDHRQIQAQVQIANAVIHQAAVIRNSSHESDYTPRFSEREKHLRLEGEVSLQHEERNFRNFLDVIGNKKDRLAATWLWLRGKAD